MDDSTNRLGCSGGVAGGWWCKIAVVPSVVVIPCIAGVVEVILVMILIAVDAMCFSPWLVQSRRGSSVVPGPRSFVISLRGDVRSWYYSRTA
jgi:hypothetical protein